MRRSFCGRQPIELTLFGREASAAFALIYRTVHLQKASNFSYSDAYAHVTFTS